MLLLPLAGASAHALRSATAANLASSAEEAATAPAGAERHGGGGGAMGDCGPAASPPSAASAAREEGEDGVELQRMRAPGSLGGLCRTNDDLSPPQLPKVPRRLLSAGGGAAKSAVKVHNGYSDESGPDGMTVIAPSLSIVSDGSTLLASRPSRELSRRETSRMPQEACQARSTRDNDVAARASRSCNIYSGTNFLSGGRPNSVRKLAIVPRTLVSPVSGST